jgi:hypothetical protein
MPYIGLKSIKLQNTILVDKRGAESNMFQLASSGGEIIYFHYIPGRRRGNKNFFLPYIYSWSQPNRERKKMGLSVLPTGRNIGRKTQKWPHKNISGRKNLRPKYLPIFQKVAEKWPNFLVLGCSLKCLNYWQK